MSELINKNDCRATIRWKLLTGTSALVLAACVSSVNMAKAEDAGQPILWVELGGGLSRLSADADPYLPPFLPSPPPPFEVHSAAEASKGVPSSWDATAKLTFQPSGTNWKFSAGIVYGRSKRDRFSDQVTQYPDTGFRGDNYGGFWAYQTIKSRNSEGHAVIDFQVGRDVGLGSFGNSTINLGIRYAHFSETNAVRIQSQPTNVGGFVVPLPYQKHYGDFTADRRFNGVGPSLSWEASVAVAGNRDAGELAVDGGINGAVLFGRQTVRGQHHLTTIHYLRYYPTRAPYRTSTPMNRSRGATAPNLGGFAGVSWRSPNAKVSIGYRADLFFGAMDGGIDAAKKENVGFYGPFASVSVGIGG